MILKRVEKDDWAKVAENIHRVCFGENRAADFNTISFALLVTDDNDMVVAYSTVIEIDKISAYMQHGGAIPDRAKTVYIAKAYHLMVNYLKENYTRISTRIRNTNRAMLKLAMSADLFIIGCELVVGELFLNHMWLKPGAKL